jgi:PDZ domain-containing protein
VRLPSIDRVPGGSAFAALSRRVRTLIIGGVLFLVLFVIALFLPVPYVVLSPGPTYNTLGTDDLGNQIILLQGKKPNHVHGHLNMTTVNVSTDSVSAVEALFGWLRSDEVVVPRSAIYPPNESTKQVETQNRNDFTASQDNATTAALCELGYPKKFGVFQVIENGPSQGLLQVGDQIVSVDGKAVSSIDQLRAVLAAKQPKQNTVVHVVRNGKPVDVPITLGTSPTGAKGGYLGIGADTTCLAPFTVQIRLANIGGPSAGLMFALGIIDEAGKADLTGGKFIAGTGEIDAQGNVKAIGGIALKMIAARDKGATVFLAPKSNCSDVRGNIPSGLRVIAVSTLHQAVTDLQNLQKAGAPAPPAC